jgi:hypothetical protein
MRTPFRVLLVLAATLALPIIAQQGAAGRWNASVDTAQGPFAFTFEFAVDAAGKLTGTMNNEFFGASFSPDQEKLLVASNASGIWNAYAVPVTGGALEPLTTSTTNAVFPIGYLPNDERIVNIRVGVRDVYQLEMLGRCPDVDWANSIAIRSRGSNYICTGLDAELIAPSQIGPQRCAVSKIRKLTAEETKALPKRARP